MDEGNLNYPMLVTDSMKSNELKEKSITQCFDEAFSSFEDICNCELPTNSSEVQYKVKKCMNLLEDITRMVSSSGMFSSNESIGEIATSDVKFLLLPALLGTLMLKLTSGDRMDIVLTAEVYFKDFLQRCKDYNLTNVDIVSNDADDTTLSLPSPADGPNTHACGSMTNLMSMARRRATKIQQYHEEKELESELLRLKELLNSDRADDETERKYYLSLIKSYISHSVEDLDCLQSEKSILKHMSKNKQSGFSEEHEKQAKKLYRSKPLQPVIITRDEIQKKVFGAGYPSLPTMTVEELYQQRITEGTWAPQNASNPSSLLDMAQREDLKVAQEEQDEIEKETAIECDDPAMLERARRMDEYKDTHKRGWGNRYNRS